MMVGMTAEMITGKMITGVADGIIAGVCDRLLGNSITAVYLIVTVIVIRVLFRKAPAVFRCILWGLVGVRLVLPFDIQIDRGILPSGEEQLRQIAETTGVTDTLWVSLDNGAEAGDEIGASVDTWIFNEGDARTTVETSVEIETLAGEDISVHTKAQRSINIFFRVWLVGVLGMMGYLVWQYVSLRSRLREAVREEWTMSGEPCEVYLAEGIQTPFLFGMLRPRIYLPYRSNTDYAEYVLRHEQMHRKHFDHLKKNISFILLSVYWFHPLVWLAYFLYGRDLELACDERVIKDYDLENRKNYSKALLYFADNRKRIQICPLAFGEIGIKERIQKVLDYKKPAFWVIIGATVVVLGTCGIFFLNRGTENGNSISGSGINGSSISGSGINGSSINGSSINGNVNSSGDDSSGVNNDARTKNDSAGAENNKTPQSSRVVQEFVDYLGEKGEYIIAVKALSHNEHYDRENKYYYEIMDYVPAMEAAETAFAWGPYRAVFPEDGRPLEVWEKEDKFRTDHSQSSFSDARLRLAKDCAYYACYSFSQGTQDEDKRRINWETFYNLFTENQSYDEVYCNVKYKDGEVTELTLLNVYPTLKTGDDFLGMTVDETDFTEAVRAGKQQDGLYGNRANTLYRTKMDGQDYLLELEFYSANNGRSYVTYRIYRCEEISRNAFSAVYADGCHFEVRNARISGYPIDYPAKDMEAFYNAIAPYVQNSDGKWSWEDGTFLDGDYAVHDLSKDWEMHVLTAEHAKRLRAQQYTLIQDTRIENPYFSLTVPEEFVGKVGYQVSVDSLAKKFSVTFVLDEAAEKVTRYGMLGEYEQLQETGRNVLGWVSWQDLKDIVWMDKGAAANSHASFILACLDEVDFERAWRVHRLLFGFGGERNAVCYNQDKSGAYCAFVPTDVQYDPANSEEAERYLTFSDLFKERMENGDFETEAFPFTRLTEAEREYLNHIKEKYAGEQAQIVVDMKKSEPYTYRIAKEQGWIKD